MSSETMGRLLGVFSCAALIAACSSETTATEDAGSGGSGGTAANGIQRPVFPDPDEPEPGCGTLSEEEARSLVTTNLDTVARRALDGLRFAEGSAALARALSLGGGGQLEFVDDSEDTIDDLVERVSTRLLAHENFESAEGSTVVFKMQPDVVCPPTAEDLENDPEGAAEDEASCRQALAEHDVRARVTRINCGPPGGSVELTFSVTTEPLEPLVPLVVHLHPESITLALDVKDTALALERLGSFEEGVTLDPGLGGVIGARLAVYLPESVTGWVEILEDVSFGASTADGEHTRVSAAAAQLFSFRADPWKEIFGGVNAAAVSFDLQLENFIQSFLDREPTEVVVPSDSVTLSAPGLSGEFLYEADTDTLTVTDFGLLGGPIRASYGEATLLEIDWNAAAGRLLDFVLTPNGDDASITLGEKGLDLELSYAMDVIADKVADLPEFMRNDTLHVKFGPEAPVALLLEDPNVDVDDLLLVGSQEGALLRVESGSLELTSSAVPDENVTVQAGQCLLRDSSVVGEHAFLGSLSTGACPSSTP